MAETPTVVDCASNEDGRIDEAIFLARTGDASQLILSGFGLFVSKKEERLIVRKGKELLYELPFYRLNELTLASRGISLSSDLIMELCERGVQINFLRGSGRPYAKILAPELSATVQARREQFKALDDHRAVVLSKEVIAGKIRNQRSLLLYFGKYMKHTAQERYDLVNQAAANLKGLLREATRVQGDHMDEVRNTLLGIEGTAGRIYWGAVQNILSEKISFPGRVRRGATDEVNSMLNYGYGILYAQVWGAVISAGLEPFRRLFACGSPRQTLFGFGPCGGVPAAGRGSHSHRPCESRRICSHGERASQCRVQKGFERKNPRTVGIPGKVPR